MIILWSFIILASMGLILGLFLAIADKVFYVKSDTRIEDISNMLPNYNCGSCGFAGCNGFAEAIVKGEVKHLNQCKPGKNETNYNPIIEYLENHPNDDGTIIKVEI